MSVSQAFELAEVLGWSRDCLMKALDLPRSTVLKKQGSNDLLRPSHSERVIRLADLVVKVSSMVERSGSSEDFDAGKWTGRWLLEPLPALEWQAPATLLNTNDGAQLVLQLLLQMESGAYA